MSFSFSLLRGNPTLSPLPDRFAELDVALGAAEVPVVRVEGAFFPTHVLIRSRLGIACRDDVLQELIRPLFAPEADQFLCH
jgi:hypothetical protein